MKIFHICTIFNDLDQFDKMKLSFLENGFDLNRCNYSSFDNRNGNSFDPYETFNLIQSSIENDKYIVFCHQDVRLDQGCGFNELINKLQELDDLDSSWSLCGNAGVNPMFKYVVKINDPNKSPNWQGTFPQRAISLDENFLVAKTANCPTTSSGLIGFHFYATDLCLNAISSGLSCYVIDFKLTHLSGGSFSPSYWKIKSEFYEYWKAKFGFCYLKTMTGQWMCFARNSLARKIGSIYVVRKLCIFLNSIHPFLYPKADNRNGNNSNRR